jgi:tyrosine decarboxylase/aspartate 1-decarboxylase
MKHWKKLSHKEQDIRISNALTKNIDYQGNMSLGIPVSKLDSDVFDDRASFLTGAPLLRTYVQNPNHIGCHTMGNSEPFFSGTQELEREVIELLSVDILQAQDQGCDGYITAGGTEANIQAAWIYRNYFMELFAARIEEIALLSSADTHYSVAKAANLLQLRSFSVPVDDVTRVIEMGLLDDTVKQAKNSGIKYFIVFSNMATTMFGSVDDPDVYAACLSDFRHRHFPHQERVDAICLYERCKVCGRNRYYTQRQPLRSQCSSSMDDIVYLWPAWMV